MTIYDHQPAIRPRTNRPLPDATTGPVEIHRKPPMDYEKAASRLGTTQQPIQTSQPTRFKAAQQNNLNRALTYVRRPAASGSRFSLVPLRQLPVLMGPEGCPRLSLCIDVQGGSPSWLCKPVNCNPLVRARGRRPVAR